MACTAKALPRVAGWQPVSRPEQSQSAKRRLGRSNKMKKPGRRKRAGTAPPVFGPGSFSPDQVHAIVDMANARADAAIVANRTGQPHTTLLKRDIDSAEIVYGVWQDRGEPHGVGICLVKGLRRYHAMAHGAGLAPPGTTLFRLVPQEVRTTAIRCSMYEEAVVMRQVYCPEDEPEA